VGTGEVYSLTPWFSNGGMPVMFLYFRPMILCNQKEYGREINGREYTVIDDDGPTVNEPYFVLYSEGDGMDYVTLKLVSDTASDSALLSMLPQDGSAERVYTCPLDEMKPLTDWMASN